MTIGIDTYSRDIHKKSSRTITPELSICEKQRAFHPTRRQVHRLFHTNRR